MRPPFPIYTRTPFTGELPTPSQIGPVDVRPSKLNPSLDVYRAAYGAPIAGLGEIMNTPAAEGIKDYANELDSLQIEDDVESNGVFDPFGTHGNLHADSGVFADRQSIPGYLARERFYAPSEVIDATSDGGHVMYVPGGAVAIDEAQRQAYDNRLLWELPRTINPLAPFPVEFDSSVIPREPALPVGAMEAIDRGDKIKVFAGAAVAGLVLGGLIAYLIKK